jgi:hypothetical protein
VLTIGPLVVAAGYLPAPAGVHASDVPPALVVVACGLALSVASFRR